MAEVRLCDFAECLTHKVSMYDGFVRMKRVSWRCIVVRFAHESEVIEIEFSIKWKFWHLNPWPTLGWFVWFLYPMIAIRVKEIPTESNIMFGPAIDTF